jgi:hypothetical protein
VGPPLSGSLVTPHNNPWPGPLVSALGLPSPDSYAAIVCYLEEPHPLESVGKFGGRVFLLGDKGHGGPEEGDPSLTAQALFPQTQAPISGK